MTKILRPYQEEAVQSVFDYYRSGKIGNPIIVLPTGAGKSLVLSELIKRCHTGYRQCKFMQVTHALELLAQNEAELKEHYPYVSTSFYCAKMRKKKTHADVVFASIQSIWNKADRVAHNIDVMIIDEAHLISNKDVTRYRKFISAMLARNPQMKVIGLTATPFRAESGYLHATDNSLFTDIVYDAKIRDLINAGYLAPLITPKTSVTMDVSSVSMRGGDFITSELDKAINQQEITKPCIADLINHGRERKKWLVFAATIAHAENICLEIESYGISTKLLTGNTPDTERQKIIHEYKAGNIQCLVNVAVLTTGFNEPSIDLIAMLRPTRSPTLYVQCVGRGTRISPGKENCMVLDYGGIIDALGPIDAIKIPDKMSKGKKGDAPIKVCPTCYEINYASARQCSNCEYEFSDGQPKLEKKASNKSILYEPPKPQIISVESASYRKCQKEGKKPYLLCDYKSGIKTVRDFKFFDWPHVDSRLWWIEASGGTAVPASAEEAAKRQKELKKPHSITIIKDGKYDKILETHY